MRVEALFPPMAQSLEPQLAGDAPRGLGRAIAGGGEKAKRRANDYYPTPRAATEALLRHEAEFIRAWLVAAGGAVWEPCGRGGAIGRVLADQGFAVVATDIVADPAHDVVGLDLLQADVPLGLVVMTNPPFALAADMIVHLLARLKVRYLALLLKSTFWQADNRQSLLADHPPARRYDLAWRLDFTGGGSPTMECSWFVWDAAGDDDGMRWQTLVRGGPMPALF